MYDAAEPLIRGLDSPVVILSGTMLAVVLNLWGVIHLSGSRDTQGLTATIRVDRRPFNLIVALLAAAVLGAIMLYLVLENFAPR